MLFRLSSNALPDEDWCLNRRSRVLPLSLADNDFPDATEIEFFDAQATTWSGNTLPGSGVCVDNISSDKGEDIRTSTFESFDSLPGDC